MISFSRISTFAKILTVGLPLLSQAGASAQVAPDVGAKAGPNRGAAAAPARPTPAPTPCTWDALVPAWFALADDFFRLEDHVKGYLATFRKEEWKAIRNNEISVKKRSPSAIEEMKRIRAGFDPNKVYSLSLDMQAQQYDFDHFKFPTRIISGTSVSFPGPGRELGDGIPRNFAVSFTNDWMITKIPMTPDAAQAWLESFRGNEGGGARRVKANLLFRIVKRGNTNGTFQALILSGTLYDPRNNAILHRFVKDNVVESIGLKLVSVPAGEFDKALSEEQSAQLLKLYPGLNAQSYHGFAHESNRNHVEIKTPFLMGAHEVTVGQFRRFVEEMDYKTSAEGDGQMGHGFDSESKQFKPSREYSWKNPGFKQADDHPVTNVSWYDARAFCAWLSGMDGRTFRPPFELEWEYACRAGTTGLFLDRDDPDELHLLGNVADKTLTELAPAFSPAVPGSDGHAFTAPVGRFKANAFGLFDMIGNVREWCNNEYGTYSQDQERSSRGGGWDSGPPMSRPTTRRFSEPRSWSCSLGFRVMTEDK